MRRAFIRKSCLLLFSFLLNIALFVLALGVRFDNSVWLDDKNPHKKNKDYLYTEFDRGEDLVVAIDLQADFFQPRFISLFSKITEELEEVEGVLEVKNPLSATTIIQHNNIMQILSFKEALEQNIIPNLNAYKQRFTDSEYHGQLLSPDYRKLAMIVKIEAPLAEYNHYRRDKILKNTRSILKTHLQRKHSFSSRHLSGRMRQSPLFQLEPISDVEQKDTYFTGEVRLYHALAKYTQDDLFVLLPAVTALIFLLLYFVFRNLIKVCIIIYISLSVLGLSFAVFVLRDYPLTAVGISLPVLIMVIAIADAIHIFNRWHELTHKLSVPAEVLRQTIRETWLPCLLTSITTGVGFGSFYFSELIPLRNFGEVSLIVIMLAYAMIVLNMWLFLWIFGERLKQDSADLHPRLARMLAASYRFTARAHLWILAFVFLLTALGLYSLRFLRTETNFLDVFFKQSSSIYQDFEYVDEHLGGTGAVDVLIGAQDEEAFKKIETLNSLQSATELLLDYRQVNYVRSYLTPIRMVHKEFAVEAADKRNALPQKEDQLAQEILFLEFSRGDQKNDVLSPYVDFDYTNSRIHSQTPNLNSSAAKRIREYIQENLKLPAGQKYQLTGSSIYFQALGEYVIDTQILSILITLGTVWVLLIIQHRFKLATLGVLANSLPILLTTAFIIYLGIPFDFATVLISSVSFGLCVDDTIHFLHFYHLQKKRLRGFEAQITSVIRMIGQPIFFTSVLFSLGFAVFIISDLVVLIKFGVFTFFSLILAFFANIIMLPALIKLIDGKTENDR